MDEFFNEKELAGILKVSTSTLQKWRCQNKGPRYYKINGSIRYSKQTIIDYLKGTEV